MKILLTDREGGTHDVDGEAGMKLMEAIRDVENSVEAICGGMCSCATCHVYVDPAWFARLQPIEDDEEDLLDSLEGRRDNSRLSCQIELVPELDGIAVTVGPEE